MQTNYEFATVTNHYETVIRRPRKRVRQLSSSLAVNVPSSTKATRRVLWSICSSCPFRTVGQSYARFFLGPLLLKSHFMDSVPDAAKTMAIWNANMDVYMLVENLDQTFSQSKSNLTSQPAVLDQFKLEPISSNFMGGRARPTGHLMGTVTIATTTVTV